MLSPPPAAAARTQAAVEHGQQPSDGAFRAAVARAAAQRFSRALARLDHDRLVADDRRIMSYQPA